jgi:hypothetical protein
MRERVRGLLTRHFSIPGPCSYNRQSSKGVREFTEYVMSGLACLESLSTLLEADNRYICQPACEVRIGDSYKAARAHFIWFEGWLMRGIVSTVVDGVLV